MISFNANDFADLLDEYSFYHISENKTEYGVTYYLIVSTNDLEYACKLKRPLTFHTLLEQFKHNYTCDNMNIIKKIIIDAIGNHICIADTNETRSRIEKYNKNVWTGLNRDQLVQRNISIDNAISKSEQLPLCQNFRNFCVLKKFQELKQSIDYQKDLYTQMQPHINNFKNILESKFNTFYTFIAIHTDDMINVSELKYKICYSKNFDHVMENKHNNETISSLSINRNLPSINKLIDDYIIDNNIN